MGKEDKNNLIIYNTLTKEKDDFHLKAPSEVKMYTCGVTVYDDCHIGHARSLYIFEVIRRYLSYKGFKVKFIRNITDIDDKIIIKAREWSKKDSTSLKEAFNKVREHYIKSYKEDLRNLKLPQADHEPMATENIPDMITFIEGLIKKGFAYQKGGNVYFRIRKFSKYGKLSGRRVDELFEGVRVEADPLKEDPLDFALWKEKKEDEPFWPSPFGDGRPGWHIECSVMSLKHLKAKTLDIHGGGKDLIFPHHENEIAQSEPFTGEPFAKFWIHHGLLTINDQKMAKSLGNYITIKDLLKKYSPDVVKLFFLSVHYSHPIDFTWELLEEKRKALRQRIITFLMNVEEKEKGTLPNATVKDSNNFWPSGKAKEKIERLRFEFERYMDNDFNTPLAITVLFEIARVFEGALFYDTYEEEYLSIVQYARDTISEFGDILGLTFQEEPWDYLEELIRKRINRRNELRRQKKFEEADKIRKELEKKGILLEDTKDGTKWRLG